MTWQENLLLERKGLKRNEEVHIEYNCTLRSIDIPALDDPSWEEYRILIDGYKVNGILIYSNLNNDPNVLTTGIHFEDKTKLIKSYLQI